MLENFPAHYGDLIREASQLLSDHFCQSIQFSKITQLSEPERRNLILRLSIACPKDNIPATVIFKKTAIEVGTTNEETEHEQLSRFAHDWAGLEFLTKIGGDHAPKFYAGSLKHQFILIEDLGVTHTSLVGPLTCKHSTSNLQQAEAALICYAERLGKMHADTAEKFDLYNSIVDKIHPNAHHVHSFSDSDIAKVQILIKKLTGCDLQALEPEIADIVLFSKKQDDFMVLLHGDICPDNVYYQDDDMRFIDYEFCDFGNAFIDGSYLRMFMPSCWCSKKFPDSIIDKMESIPVANHF
jgi:hypothetical protein